MSVNKKIAVISNEIGWHTKRVIAAFERYGCQTYAFSLPDCEFFVENGKRSLYLPELGDNLPDAAFIRCIPQGSFEQVTFYLDVLHALEAQGVLVYNHARAIECSVDKVMTTFLLAQAGLPTPKTWAGINQSRAKTIIEQYIAEDKALVMKPMFGSQGNGLQRIDRDCPVPELKEDAVYYLQEFIDGSTEHNCWRDWRLLVVGGQVSVSIERKNNHWVNNVAQGGRCYPVKADETMIRYAEIAANSVNAAYAGIDLMRDQNGQLWVIEVNSIPAWKGAQCIMKEDIATILAADLLRRL